MANNPPHEDKIDGSKLRARQETLKSTTVFSGEHLTDEKDFALLMHTHDWALLASSALPVIAMMGESKTCRPQTLDKPLEVTSSILWSKHCLFQRQILAETPLAEGLN
ncbi:hypothetical protein CISG_01708 [Coccidioides immitis RMSCC 3703]|uniref:Uncharacterized protein n=2 Tax=Coccidioides immitis TaxID=5501 RepID=A0A0J8R4N3_COCIT|nr:hypothetical protein CIRG_08350 [Coccidioides immitis RMSCC 2394]KMU78668.1 hypothetical protein CISG_01708 [Coccidioides immitis RMSCC 3703]